MSHAIFQEFLAEHVGRAHRTLRGFLGVNTDRAWKTHLKRRWPQTSLRSAPVFGETESSVDSHQKYLEKHCHDILHCVFFDQHQGKHFIMK